MFILTPINLICVVLLKVEVPSGLWMGHGYWIHRERQKLCTSVSAQSISSAWLWGSPEYRIIVGSNLSCSWSVTFMFLRYDKYDNHPSADNMLSVICCCYFPFIPNNSVQPNGWGSQYSLSEQPSFHSVSMHAGPQTPSGTFENPSPSNKWEDLSTSLWHPWVMPNKRSYITFSTWDCYVKTIHSFILTRSLSSSP